MSIFLLALCLCCWFPQDPARAATAKPAVTGDVSGEWSGEITLPNSYSPIPLYCKLTQGPDGVSGTAGPSAATLHPITGVKREGDRLRFTVSSPPLEYSFDLVLSRDRLEGTARSKDGEFTSDGKAALARVKTKEPHR